MKRIFELVGLAVVVLSTAGLAGCGGGPDTGHTDGADTTSPGPATTGDDMTTPPSGDPCAEPAFGCSCANEGETVACKGPVLRNGDYISCAGTRSCTSGHWGLCMPPSYHTATQNNAKH